MVEANPIAWFIPLPIFLAIKAYAGYTLYRHCGEVMNFGFGTVVWLAAIGNLFLIFQNHGTI